MYHACAYIPAYTTGFVQIRTNRFKSLCAILGFIQECILIKEWEYSTVSKNGAERPTFKIIKRQL